jgi:hypothetical protein
VAETKDNPLRAWGLAIGAFVLSLGAVMLLLPLLLRVLFGHGHPYDAGAGESGVWEIVFGAPIFVPLALAVAGGVAAFVFGRVRGHVRNDRPD